MKILFLQISNVMSFKHHDDVSTSEKIAFFDSLNIIIGENGSGKSTALEVINFIFKRVLYRQSNLNQELYERRSTLPVNDRKQILLVTTSNSFNEFRLDPNWDTPAAPQTIRIAIQLDAIDKKNIASLLAVRSQLTTSTAGFTTRKDSAATTCHDEYELDIVLNAAANTFSVDVRKGAKDFGYEYLSDYNFFKDAIILHNQLNPRSPIPLLHESFTLISSYRNYHAFQPSISLKDSHPAMQMMQIRNSDYSKGLNTSDTSEPTIFGYVRLRVAEAHFDLISQRFSEQECEEKANELAFLKNINKRLEIVGLECKIKLLDLRQWQYRFEFTDKRRGKNLLDINNLSAGQKAIIHLVFEAYGRGFIKGGLVIIDEPEIHLHYQFQNEYLQVIRELNKDQHCQYILVTHSEALINSTTINQVKRFSLNKDGNTEIKSPELTTDEKTLIKVLDNTRSTYAFFAKKVLLVEGDTDRYFYKAIVQELYSRLDQEIAVLFIGGKGNFDEWTKLFEAFGLLVFRIADFDYIIDKCYPSEKGLKLKTAAAVSAFKARNTDWMAMIDAEYSNGTFILKDGDLETYLGISKGLPETIEFCNTKLTAFLADDSDHRSREIKTIVATIAG